jgi:hypothetical protein
MDRRTVLRRTGALGTLVLAGCSGDGNGTGETPAGNGTTATPNPTGTPAPAVTDSVVSTVGTDCLAAGTGERASVTVDAEAGTVTVAGLVETSDPCHEATLHAVSYADDEIRIDVVAEPTGEACVDCIGAVEYEATVSFVGPEPETVTVTHHGEPAPTPSGTDTPTPASTSMLDRASLVVTDVSGDAEETADVQFDPETSAGDAGS